MDTAPGSIVHPSIRSGSVRVVAGSWCLAAVRSGAQPVALEVASPFSILVVEPAPKNGDGAGDRGACPQAPGHRTAQAWREGLDVAQISWKGSASGSSAPFGRGVGGWTAGRGGPRPPPHGSGGALVGPAILRAL